MRPTDLADRVPGGPRVLLAGGRPDDDTVLTYMLRLRGVDATACVSAADLLTLAAAEKARAVLLDPGLPDDDWRRVAALLSALPDPPAVLVLSADVRHRPAAAAVGAAFLLKPADPDELVALIGRPAR